MAKKIELDVQETPEVRTPINYKELCTLVGELYVESYIKVTSIRRQAIAADEDQQKQIAALQKQVAELENQVKELEALSEGGQGNDS